MLDTISEEDVSKIRRVLRGLFVVSAMAELGVAIFCAVRAAWAWGQVSGEGFVVLVVVLATACAFNLAFARACLHERTLETFQ